MVKEILSENGEMSMKDICLTISRAAVSAIPYVGGSIASVWSDLESTCVKRKIERFQELVEELQKDFEVIKDKVNHDFVSVPDCQDIFEKMSRMVVNERLKEKRILYKNAYLHSMTAQIVNFDLVERDLRLIEQLNKLEILLLKIFENPQEYNKNVGNIIKNPFLDENGDWTHSYQRDYFMMEQIMRLMPKEVEIEDVRESLLFLSQNRILIDRIEQKQLSTNASPIDIFNDVLTNKGKRFVKRLKDI